MGGFPSSRVMIVALGGLAAAAWFSGGFFEKSDICSHCAAERRTKVVMWIPFSTIRETTLSRHLASSATPGIHRWEYIGGHGGPIRCSLGTGRALLQSARSPDVVRALEIIRNHQDTAADAWTKRLLDPKTSSNARFALYALDSPSDDFAEAFSAAEETYQDSLSSKTP